MYLWMQGELRRAGQPHDSRRPSDAKNMQPKTKRNPRHRLQCLLLIDMILSFLAHIMRRIPEGHGI